MKKFFILIRGVKIMKKFFLCLFLVFCVYPVEASIPQWRILWVILPQINATHTDGTRYVFSLQQDEINIIREMSERTERFIEAATNHAVDIEITVVESNGTVTSLTENDSHLFVDEGDFPSDIKRIINIADDAGNPYHLKVATFRLDGTSNGINNWHGLGGGTYARVRFLGKSYYTESESSPHPEEVWLHELLHCFEGLFEKYGTMAGLHDAEKYGYKDINGWYKWYWDIFAGQVKNPSTGELVGIKTSMWQHVPLGRVEYWRGHTYKIFDLVRSWNSAKEYCESLGGHLVTITSQEEQNIVATLLNRVSIWNYPGYWMGGKKESNWRWITGEAFKYTNFSKNQPDGSGDYLEMYNYPDPGYWDDTTSNANIEIQGNLYPRGIICEWEYIMKPSTSILTPNHLPGGIINTRYNQTLTSNENSTWTCVSGKLPNGLTINTEGLISGIPTTVGSFDFTVKAEKNSDYDLKTFTIEITTEPIKPIITTVDLKEANVGEEYHQALEISGSYATWRIINKYLPENLILSTNGEITGTPSIAGEYEFTVRAENNIGYNDKSFTLVVNAKQNFPEKEQDGQEDNNDNNQEYGNENQYTKPESIRSEVGGCNCSNLGIFTLLLMITICLFKLKLNHFTHVENDILPANADR